MNGWKEMESHGKFRQAIPYVVSVPWHFCPHVLAKSSLFLLLDLIQHGLRNCGKKRNVYTRLRV